MSILAIQVLPSEYAVGMKQTNLNFPLKFHQKHSSQKSLVF